jgi:probable O-glycosylation ligase (exosortase A-associated)
MGRLFFILAIGATATASLARPWIGVIGSYVIVVLGPQYIWWWHFQGLRAALWIMLPTLVGFSIALVRGSYDLSILKNRRNVFVLLLWASFTLSYYFGPYVDVGGSLRVTDAAWAIELIHKMMILYFLACVCIDDERRTRALAYVLIGSTIYLIYWANNSYLSGQAFGRIPGPSNPFEEGQYGDGNNFAILFVVGLPYLWYAGLAASNSFVRGALWVAIPLGWHAVFLTGSRGGLVGLGATLLLTVWRSKRRSLGFLLLPVFAVAYIWQAGDVMKERAGTIIEYQTETSASSRLEAWDAATNMIREHSITGVGLSSFITAFPDYSDAVPREAHNTFFQIAGESGLLAGAMYLAIVTSSLLVLWRNGIRLRRRESDINHEVRNLLWINEATLVGFSGLVICSLFLSLQLFELFYFLLVLVNTLNYQIDKLDASAQIKDDNAS